MKRILKDEDVKNKDLYELLSDFKEELKDCKDKDEKYKLYVEYLSEFKAIVKDMKEDDFIYKYTIDEIDYVKTRLMELYTGYSLQDSKKKKIKDSVINWQELINDRTFVNGTYSTIEFKNCEISFWPEEVAKTVKSEKSEEFGIEYDIEDIPVKVIEYITINDNTIDATKLSKEEYDLFVSSLLKSVKASKAYIEIAIQEWKNQERVQNDSIDIIENLKIDLLNGIHDFFISKQWEEDEIKDFTKLFDIKEKDGRYKVLVGAEVEYDTLSELAEALDKIIVKYDTDSYFEPEEPGLISAYVYKTRVTDSNEDKELEYDFEIDLESLAREIIEHNILEARSYSKVKEMIENQDEFLWNGLAELGHSKYFDDEDELYFFINNSFNRKDELFDALKKVFDSYYERRDFTIRDNKIKDVNPRKGESKADFISRFMEETVEEYPDNKQRLAVAYSYWNRKNKKSTKDSIEDELLSIKNKIMQKYGYEHNDRFENENSPYYNQEQWHISTEYPTCAEFYVSGDTIKGQFDFRNRNHQSAMKQCVDWINDRNILKEYNLKFKKDPVYVDDEKDWFSVYITLEKDNSVKDSDYSKNTRNNFIVPAEDLGTVKVWYANEDQIKNDYDRLVEYAENHDPRQENPMLGVSSYDQTIGKTTKRVSEGYITLNGYRIVLVKDIDEDLVVDTMQDYYDEIADMDLEEFTKTFAVNKEEFEAAFKQRSEEAKAEKKAAKEKEKELNKKRKSFEGLLTYENYISTRELLNKKFVPVSPDEDSCYIAVYEHLNNKDELYKVVSISYKGYGITASKAFGVNNPNYENAEKLCKIFILNLNDSEVAKKILNIKPIA